MTFIEQVSHPHIVRQPGLAEGKPVIAGTRIKVVQVALEHERLGWSPDEIVEAHPHLTLAQVHDALSYYYDHQVELDAQSAGDDELLLWLKASYNGHIIELDEG